MIEGKNVMKSYNLDLLYGDKYEWKQMNVRMNDQDVYEVCFEPKKKAWINWIQLIPAFQIPKNVRYNELIIPTVQL